jgi:methyl-accepting chemotaxis protein
VAANAGDVERSTEQTAQSAGEVEETAGELSQLSATLSRHIEVFLASMETASHAA